MECQIRDWFARHEGGDGDFLVATSSYPFSVIPPKDDTDIVIYCTKQHCVLRLIHDLGDEPSFAAILRGGLPSNAEADWLRSMVGSRRLLFLGDADAADLLIFAWLRDRVPIQHVGVTDELLLQCGVPLGDNLTIELAESEVDALPLVTQFLGDLTSHLGPWCSGLLSSGRKIEVEALFSFAACKPSELESAVQGMGGEA